MKIPAAPGRYEELLARAPMACQRLFGLSGRINRAWYWLYLGLAAPLLGLLYEVRFAVAAANERPQTFVPGLPAVVIESLACLLTLVILLAGMAITVRRLHDRGKSGSWIAHFVLAPGLLFWLGQRYLDEHLRAVHSLPFLLQFVALFVFVWSFVELGCRRGTVGDNRFGSDPLLPTSNSASRNDKSLAR